MKTKSSKATLTTYARHKYVVERFRYWTEIARRRSDDVDIILQFDEVFLEPDTVYRIVKNFKEDPELERQLREKLAPLAPAPKQKDTRQLKMF